jgi:hypothetical protein
MLHFWPIEPTGQVGSVPPSMVHFCEHTGVGNMLNVFVQMPLVHSVLVSLTVVQSEPKPRPPAGASMGFASIGFASTGFASTGVLLLLQATDNATEKGSATTMALHMSGSYQRSKWIR